MVEENSNLVFERSLMRVSTLIKIQKFYMFNIVSK